MSPLSSPASRPSSVAVFAGGLVRLLCILAIVAAVAVLAAAGFILYRERTWQPPPTVQADTPPETRNEQSFFHGTIGTEVVPLPVLRVLPEIFPEHFLPFKQPEAGDWVRQFGFIPSSRAPVAHPTGEKLDDLPMGFTLSNYRPKSAAPSPVKFVGLACATCHTTLLRRPDGTDYLVIGTGNSALNLFAWIDAFQAAILDGKKLTLSAVADENEKLGFPLALEEKGMIALWLQGTRAKLTADEEKYDQPYGNGDSLNPDFVPTGPGRTQPFRTLVRGLLHRPGATMRVYTKIAPVFWQNLEDGWGQYDGGIHGLQRRSSGAAYAAGATVQNMNLPEIAENIKWASDYLATRKGPRFEQVFPDRPINAEKAKRGQQVYMREMPGGVPSCNSCHGHPEGAGWAKGERQGEITPLAAIKTDQERVMFRYYDLIPGELSKKFPKEHEFDFPRDQLRPFPGEEADLTKRGYINKPLHAAFARAPYLHNASVLTLKALLNLEDRRVVFFQGENPYDPEALGLTSPTEAEWKEGDPKFYFRFDTRVPGNSSAGHDYPWPRREVVKDPQKQKDLEDLLEYLKTF
jgi:mono/diheme cytochrome c family protein